MHIAVLAPVLSAISSRVCCWIMAYSSSAVFGGANLLFGAFRGCWCGLFLFLFLEHLGGFAFQDAGIDLRGPGDDADQAPSLGAADRPAAHDLDVIADAA